MLFRFHKDIRQMISIARKTFDTGSEMLKYSEEFRDMFEERWASLALEIQALSSDGNGARVFTKEQLAGAAADILSHSHASASSSRQGRSKFTLPAKPTAKAAVSAVTCADVTEEDAVAKAAKRSSLGFSQAPHKAQHEMPKEEDLNNWSHHFSVDTIDDDYLKQATRGTDLISFVFGLHVNWELTQVFIFLLVVVPNFKLYICNHRNSRSWTHGARLTIRTVAITILRKLNLDLVIGNRRKRKSTRKKFCWKTL